MPVKHIEQQILDRGVLGNMPDLGKLRKGGEAGEKSPGKDLNYFRLTLNPEFEYIRETFEQLYGSQPTELHNVMIAADDAAKALDYWYEEWAHAKLVNRCDGEAVAVHWDMNAAGYSTKPHKCTCNPLDRTCGLVGRLKIVIPELCEATGVWGTFTILTGSIYDVTALRASMHVAGAFLGRMQQNVAFWSVPFVVGRVTRKVPVTINGKRSIKPMSLLYAQVEPDFNQKVLSPMLTAPSQMLLAGVNPETGELPEVIIEQAASWDRDYVNEQTLHLFREENHQMNTIDKLIDAGLITDQMDSSDVIQIILENREQRQAEKQSKKSGKNAPKPPVEGSNPSVVDEPDASELEWVTDVKMTHALVAKAGKHLAMDHGAVIQALQWAMGNYTIQNVAEFVGTKDDAWGACVVHHCKYDPEQVKAFIPDEASKARISALALLDRIADIPF